MTLLANRCIVLERCACSVYQQLKKYGKLSAKGDGPSRAKLNLATRVRYALDAAKGMVFLHEHQIIHHDLKSSNLLIANDKAKTVKICDFSLSNLSINTFLPPSASGSQVDTIAAEGVGTPGWIAPEELGSGMVRCVAMRRCRRCTESIGSDILSC